MEKGRRRPLRGDASGCQKLSHPPRKRTPSKAQKQPRFTSAMNKDKSAWLGSIPTAFVSKNVPFSPKMGPCKRSKKPSMNLNPRRSSCPYVLRQPNAFTYWNNPSHRTLRYIESVRQAAPVARELWSDPPHNFSREIASAIVLGNRVLRPLEEWSRIDPVKLGLAEYQDMLDSDLLRRVMLDEVSFLRHLGKSKTLHNPFRKGKPTFSPRQKPPSQGI